jgi:hypothetical protein
MKNSSLIQLLFIAIVCFSCSDSEIVKNNSPFHKIITENLKNHVNSVRLPQEMLTNSNENCKEVILGFNDFIDMSNQVIDFLEVPENEIISSNSSSNEESYSWLDTILGDIAEIKYTIKKELNQYSFVFTATAGNQSVDFLKGATSRDQTSGVIIINEGNSTAFLRWKIVEDILTLEIQSSAKHVLTIHTTNRNGSIEYGTETSYTWNEDGSGTKTDKNGNKFTW